MTRLLLTLTLCFTLSAQANPSRWNPLSTELDRIAHDPMGLRRVVQPHKHVEQRKVIKPQQVSCPPYTCCEVVR